MHGDGPSEPLARTLAHVLEAVRESGARAAVAGGIAQQVWGRVRATRDLDLLVALESDQDLSVALNKRGFRTSRPPKVLDDMTLRSFVREDSASFVDVTVGILLVRDGLGLEAVRRAVSISLGEFEVPVVTAEDLPLLKLVADRVLDRKDAEDIVRAQGTRLDLEWLRDRARQLGVAPALERVLDASKS